MGEHFFWITSRAAGISALLAASAAVSLGLLMSTRLLKDKDLRVWHEALSIATMVALAVHALSLLGDSYLKPSLLDVTLPGFIDATISAVMIRGAGLPGMSAVVMMMSTSRASSAYSSASRAL